MQAPTPTIKSPNFLIKAWPLIASLFVSACIFEVWPTAESRVGMAFLAFIVTFVLTAAAHYTGFRSGGHIMVQIANQHIGSTLTDFAVTNNGAIASISKFETVLIDDLKKLSKDFQDSGLFYPHEHEDFSRCLRQAQNIIFSRTGMRSAALMERQTTLQRPITPS